jgi:hypothetical protein
MVIHKGIHNDRKIISADRRGNPVISTGPRSGYYERPYLRRGETTYYKRTYVVEGRSYARVYRGYEYRHVRYYGYAPGYHYHPGYYRWAYNPWRGRVLYGPALWGWVGAPWYTAYPGYFAPYPVYASGAEWLTDYVIAANLQAAYQAGVEAGEASAQRPQEQPSGDPEATNQSPMTPEVKQAIADEVRQQLTAEQAAAANPQGPPPGDQVPEALSPSERVFIVAGNLDVTISASGQECGLTAGDVLKRTSDDADGNQNVTASVQSSKQSDCANGQTVAAPVQELQEMHNHFREQIDAGLKTLANKGGTGNLPQPTDTTTVPGEVPTPTPDAGAAGQLQAENGLADQTEGQVQQGGAPNSL